MTVGDLSNNFNEEQRMRLRLARNILQDFHHGNDNSVTYAFYGLIMHLLELDRSVFASSYVNEKIHLLEQAVKK